MVNTQGKKDLLNKDSISRKQTAITIKENLNEFDFIKIRNSFLLKVTIKRMKDKI